MFSKLCCAPSKKLGFKKGGPLRTVIVVGGTGAGKSEAIKQLGGVNLTSGGRPLVSSSFASCTKTSTTYDIPSATSDARYQLVDTMGLLDTKKDDEKGMENVATLLSKLSSVVGVIYVVAGRMNPSEADICDYLFNSFFDDVPSERVLVLRTKCNDWDEFDMEAEKDSLRGLVSDKMLRSPFVPVDFHRNERPKILLQMTSGIWKHMGRWTTPLPLSDKYEVAGKFTPAYKQVLEATKALENVKAELEAQRKENEELKRRLLGIENKVSKIRKTQKEKLKDELERNASRCTELDVKMAEVKQDHERKMYRLQNPTFWESLGFNRQ